MEKLLENKIFKILSVTDEKTAADFCDVITDVYDKTQDRELWLKSFKNELKLDNCFMYVGYVDDEPAGAVEFSEGLEAVYICWGAVKEAFRNRGLYKSLLVYAINYEIDRGIHKIVLNASEMGKEIYLKMGFHMLADRYNYVIEGKDTDIK